jgi:hypothetical protein
MKRLQQKYGDFGLQVIMAHSAEYEFARDITNLRSAVQRYNITTIPVGYDKYNKTWEAYGNTYWPKHILIDYNGKESLTPSLMKYMTHMELILMALHPKFVLDTPA